MVRLNSEMVIWFWWTVVKVGLAVGMGCIVYDFVCWIRERKG